MSLAGEAGSWDVGSRSGFLARMAVREPRIRAMPRISFPAHPGHSGDMPRGKTGLLQL